MTPRQAEIDAACRRRGISDAVRDRIVRLNPNTPPGERIRGYHPNMPRWWRINLDLVSKGEFIERFGRAAWDSVPNGLKYRSGRRLGIRRNDVDDNIWKIWTGEVPPPALVSWFPTKRYANDPGCVVERIGAAEFLARIVDVQIMAYPEKGATYRHEPRFVDRMKRAEGGEVGGEQYVEHNEPPMQRLRMDNGRARTDWRPAFSDKELAQADGSGALQQMNEPPRKRIGE